MAQNNAATIAPLTDRDLENAADGHVVDVDDLRDAVAMINGVLDEFGHEYADTQIPDNHGEFDEPTVIWESDDHVCIYVSYGVLHETASNDPEIPSEGDLENAVAWAHNSFARRYGASSDALGTMDAVVLPRTEAVDQIIQERE